MALNPLSLPVDCEVAAYLTTLEPPVVDPGWLEVDSLIQDSTGLSPLL